jgi:hypothetical protein
MDAPRPENETVLLSLAPPASLCVNHMTTAKKLKEPEDLKPSPTITKRIEQKQVEERVAIGAHVVHETIRREGEEELKRSSSALA